MRRNKSVIKPYENSGRIRSIMTYAMNNNHPRKQKAAAKKRGIGPSELDRGVF